YSLKTRCERSDQGCPICLAKALGLKDQVQLTAIGPFRPGSGSDRASASVACRSAVERRRHVSMETAPAARRLKASICCRESGRGGSAMQDFHRSLARWEWRYSMIAFSFCVRELSVNSLTRRNRAPASSAGNGLLSKKPCAS